MGVDPAYILAGHVRLHSFTKGYQHILVSCGSNHTLERLASLVEYHSLWDSLCWPLFIRCFVFVVSGLSKSLETEITRCAVICGDSQSKVMDHPECSKRPKPSCLNQYIAELALRGNTPGISLVEYMLYPF